MGLPMTPRPMNPIFIPGFCSIICGGGTKVNSVSVS
jgi:hypothetical protein